MVNNPVYGCRSCDTTLGRFGCFEHRDKPKVLIADIPKATMEISIRDAKIAELESALAEARTRLDRVLNTGVSWVADGCDCDACNELRDAIDAARGAK